MQSRNEQPFEVNEAYAMELYKNGEINIGELAILLVEIANKNEAKFHFDENRAEKTTQRTFK